MSTEEIHVTVIEKAVLTLAFYGKPVPKDYAYIVANELCDKRWLVRNHHPLRRNLFLLTQRGLEVARQLGIAAENGGAQ